MWLPENPASGDGVHEGPRGAAHALKDGRTFAVLGAWGDVNPHQPGEHGLYHHGTRYLSRLALRIGGKWPVLLHASTRADNVCHSTEMVSPPLSSPAALERGAVHLARSACVIAGSYRERLVLTSFAGESLWLAIGYELAADFRDMFEIRGVERLHHGVLDTPEVAGDRLRFRYTGLDGIARETVASWSPRPTRLDSSGAELVVRLEPRRPLAIETCIDCDPPATAPRLPGYAEAVERVADRRAIDRGRACRISTSNELYDQWIERSLADLSMLVTPLDSGLYPDAGLPWFGDVFGRDGLICARALLWVDREIARGVLRTLAEHQATSDDSARDAEPGKILHELRGGEMAGRDEIPFARYYGSADATPLFVMLAGAYLDVSGDRELARELWPAIEAGLGWLDRFDGFVTYKPSPRGLAHQGWKDSPASVFHDDGAIARGDIALCEVQAYAFAARIAGARIAAVLGIGDQVERQRHRAQALRERFEAELWLEDLGCYAMALDGSGRPCRIRTSNAGHALAAGIASPARARRVADTLLEPDMFSGWGIRTLSSESLRYNPASYHHGSVWPHDNGIIAEGFRRFGMTGRAAQLLRTFMEASARLELHRLPELICGFERRPELAPAPYPGTCAPQAWASSAVFQLLGAALGLEIDGRRQRVVFRRPALPPDLDEVELRGLQVGEARVDVAIERHRDRIAVAALGSAGDTEIVVA